MVYRLLLREIALDMLQLMHDFIVKDEVVPFVPRHNTLCETENSGRAASRHAAQIISTFGS